MTSGTKSLPYIIITCIIYFYDIQNEVSRKENKNLTFRINIIMIKMLIMRNILIIHRLRIRREILYIINFNMPCFCQFGISFICLNYKVFYKRGRPYSLFYISVTMSVEMFCIITLFV